MTMIIMSFDEMKIQMIWQKMMMSLSLRYEVWLELTAMIAESYFHCRPQLPPTMVMTTMDNRVG